MPLEISVMSEFSLNKIKTINNVNWLELPLVDLIHSRDDPTNVITVNRIDCIIKGESLKLGKQIQKSYENSFNTCQKPFDLDCLLRFSPYCEISQGMPLYNTKYYLGIDIDYCEKINNVISQRNKKANSLLSFKKKSTETNMIKHEGWIAIDFGTSNSTITFFDNKEGTNPNELSEEQRKHLLELLDNWLSSDLSSSSNEINEWDQFIEQVNQRLKQPWSKILSEGSSHSLLEGIRQLEIALGNRLQDPLYLTVSKKLNQIYNEVFRQPPLQKYRIILAELDKNSPKENEIISELKIEGDTNGFLDVSMGVVAHNDRLSAISENSSDEGSVSWEEIAGKFHHSPKRYLNKINENITIYSNKSPKIFTYSELIKAAFKHLIGLAEEFKDVVNNRNRCSGGKFYRAIVTYPTVTRPEVRRKLEELVRDIITQKFSETDIRVDVNRDFDEAIAAGIFYLWREFGGNHTIGIEAFKTRCRRMGQKWAQNLLVLDIGGGTTDLALIRLQLEEKNPFKPGEDRGAGGRYYVLSPELMGSSGHLQLGGEYITLRLFLLLKVAIVDNLLTAIAEGKLVDETLAPVITSLDELFKSGNNYRSQSLLECIDKENSESDSNYDVVLNYAERVIPTRWKDGQNDRKEQLQAFYTLWEVAENIKVKLSQEKDLLAYEISQGSNEFNDLIGLLRQNKIEIEENILAIKVSREQFDRVATPVIEEAINLARGLLESRLPMNEKDGKKEPLDWLILSGQTCHLDIVERKITEIFSKGEFDWNPARITFVPKYAKLATSIGACYGVTLQQRNLSPEGAKSKLRNGYSELDIKVENLLYTLPCSFVREIQASDEERIFDARQTLYQFKPNEEAKAQSGWFGVQQTITVRRQDFDNKRSEPWYNLAFKNDIADSIGIYSDEAGHYNSINVQFEVNQTLEIGMLLCNGAPHYSVDDEGPKSRNLNEIISQELKNQNIQELIPQALIIDGVLQWEIVVGIDEESPHSVFKQGERLNETFHSESARIAIIQVSSQPSRITSSETELPYSEEEQESCKGVLSKDKEQKPLPLPAFPRSGKHTFYAYYPSLASPDPLCRPIPLCVLGFEEENYQCYVTLDERGIVRLHSGEIPYWMSEDPCDLKEKGRVFLAKPSPIKEEDNDKRNPFSGTH